MIINKGNQALAYSIFIIYIWCNITVMTWLSTSIILASTLYLIANYYSQKKAEREHWEQVQLAQDAVNKMNDNLERVSLPIFDAVLQAYGWILSLK